MLMAVILLDENYTFQYTFQWLYQPLGRGMQLLHAILFILGKNRHTLHGTVTIAIKRKDNYCHMLLKCMGACRNHFLSLLCNEKEFNVYDCDSSW